MHTLFKSDVGSIVPADLDGGQDGVFNSSDLVIIFQAGEYEDNESNNSSFDEGDFDGDGDFTTADLVFAFESGTFHREVALNIRSVDLLFEKGRQVEDNAKLHSLEHDKLFRAISE